MFVVGFWWEYFPVFFFLFFWNETKKNCRFINIKSIFSCYIFEWWLEEVFFCLVLRWRELPPRKPEKWKDMSKSKWPVKKLDKKNLTQKKKNSMSEIYAQQQQQPQPNRQHIERRGMRRPAGSGWGWKRIKSTLKRELQYLFFISRVEFFLITVVGFVNSCFSLYFTHH